MSWYLSLLDLNASCMCTHTLSKAACQNARVTAGCFGRPPKPQRDCSPYSYESPGLSDSRASFSGRFGARNKNLTERFQSGSLTGDLAGNRAMCTAIGTVVAATAHRWPPKAAFLKYARSQTRTCRV